VDKTGTLTEGMPRLTVVVAAEGCDETYLLQAAGGLEKASEHPLAAAILLGAKEKGTEPSDVTHFQSVTGGGVTGIVQGKQIGVGNVFLMQDIGATYEVLRKRAEALRTVGQTVMFLAVDGRFARLIAVANPIKASPSRRSSS